MRQFFVALYAAVFVCLGWNAGAAPFDVPDTPRSVTYTVSSSTSNFDLPFTLYGDCTDLSVTVAGVVKNYPTDWTCVSKSGTPLANVARPVTDGQVQMVTPVTSSTVIITGAWHPRWTAATGAGITRSEFNRTIGTLFTKQRETYDFLQNQSNIPVLSVAGRTGNVILSLADVGVSISGSSLLKGNGVGGVGNATAGTDYLAPTGSAAGLTGLTSSQVTGALTFTPVNKSGDTMSGPLNLAGSAAYGSPLLQSTVTESQSAGTNFVLGSVIQATRTGGSGHREALGVIQNSSNASSTEFVVGGQATGHATAGSGLVFGWNPYCLVDSGVATTAQCTGEESNTDIRNTSVVNKTGIQVVDVATSTGFGTSLDAGVAILNQTGGRGYGNAIQVGTSVSNPGVANGGSILVAAGGNITNGIDLSRMTSPTGVITGNAFVSPGFSVGPTGATTVASLSGGPTDGAWTTYTPTMTWLGTAPTTSTPTARFKKTGSRTYQLQAKMAVSSLGSGAGVFEFSLPATATDTFACSSIDQTNSTVTSGAYVSGTLLVLNPGTLAAHTYVATCTFESTT